MINGPRIPSRDELIDMSSDELERHIDELLIAEAVEAGVSESAYVTAMRGSYDWLRWQWFTAQVHAVLFYFIKTVILFLVSIGRHSVECVRGWFDGRHK